MRIKTLFSIPDGEKVTDKALRKVLILSICSILLCMSCLVGTSWAWFTVSIENMENVIQIGTPEVKLTVDGQAFEAGTQLSAGEHTVSIEHANELDDLRQKSTLYVTLTMDETTCAYTMLGGQNPYQTDITIVAERPCGFSWTVSWFEPANAEPLTDNIVNITVEEPTHMTEETTTPTTTESTSVSEETTPSPTAEATTAG